MKIAVTIITAVLSTFLLSTHAFGATLVATAEAAFLVPPVAPRGESVANGDFFITANSRGRGTGNGSDENTIWAFNFRLDRESFQAFRDADPAELKGAILKIRAITHNPQGQGNDTLVVGKLRQIAVDSFPAGVNFTTTINLLDHFTSQEILGELRQDRPDGIIFMRYLDDAIINSAVLKLTYRP